MKNDFFKKTMLATWISSPKKHAPLIMILGTEMFLFSRENAGRWLRLARVRLAVGIAT
jgi:hypothetical protein